LRPSSPTSVLDPEEHVAMSDASTREFHLTLRVGALDRSTAFYAWLLDVAPRTTSKYHSVIVDPKTSTNLVLVAAGASEGGSANVHHLVLVF